MTPEDGTGLTNADSYVDSAGAFATNYVGSSLYATLWAAADSARRAAACVQATRTLDALFTWYGSRLTATQALGWPRVGVYQDGVLLEAVPLRLQMATLEMAFALLERNRTSDTNSGSQPLESLSLGDGALEIKFGGDPTTQPITEVNMIPPYVVQLLRWLGYVPSRRPGGMVRMERR